MKPKRIAIIGAGAAGLMAADVLSASGMSVDVYESKPSVGRKFLMAGKGGLNITHNEPLSDFIGRYDKPDWLEPMIRTFDPSMIRVWMKSLGVDSFVGSSGLIFPTEMKAAPLLRRWLSSLKKRGVRVHCRHYWKGFGDQGSLRFDSTEGEVIVTADATILALGGGSWPSLGSDGAWVSILGAKGVPLNPLLPSNCGFKATWSDFMQTHLGSPLKNISGWVNNDAGEKSINSSEAILTSYGIEGGLIYALSRPLRENITKHGSATLYLDLLPHISEADLVSRLTSSGKQSRDNTWRKGGLDGVKAALIRETLPKGKWNDSISVAACVKRYPITLTGMQPIEEAISTAGGVMREGLNENLMFLTLPNVFCAGEMLDWDAPTGGYLLSGCFASGAFAAQGVLETLTS
ncbi:TIGR03862 family flavoprotein [Sulfuricurvum sp.]|uniref:TIGR03862 family flavoprotein n=1 Tax=Sulfuricurvum sp. TaxID=2025608 RepID=UPI0025F7DAE4|nr:TIGR03862 family flavoprotein [Sulfuricurvum sp.]